MSKPLGRWKNVHGKIAHRRKANPRASRWFRATFFERLEDRRMLAAGLVHSILSDPSPQSEAMLGFSVAATPDYLVAGAPFAARGGHLDVGEVKVYSASTKDLLYTLDNPTPSDYELFGRSVAVSGNFLVVGSPGGGGATYVYDLASENPALPLVTLENPNPSSNAFGYAVSISGDHVVVGAPNDDTGNSVRYSDCGKA